MDSDTSALFKNVLLVEDDPGHALLIKRAMKAFVAEITHVETVAQALAELQERKPELIVTDLNLPDSGGPGPQRLDHVRKFLALEVSTPVIVLTSSTALDDAVDAMRMGARDFIVKNFDGDFKSLLGLSLSRLLTMLLIEQDRARLQREMLALRESIENGADGFAIISSRGELLYSNRAYLKFVESCGAAAAGLFFENFTSKVAKHEQLISDFRRALSTLTEGAVFTTEVTFVQDKQHAFGVSISGIKSSEAGHPQFVVWVRDISEQLRREKFQREILSTTTHDLKGPLGAIMISSELLLDLVGQRPGKEKELVLRIASSAQGAINLIDEFLSARRIQEGTFILKPQPQSLAALTSEVIENQLPIATARAISLELGQSEGDVSVPVDRIGFQRVLGNLLSNALKFTPRGGSVRIMLHGSAEEVRLSVQDTGSGMEPSEVQRLFQRFSRLEKHQQIAGTGLGLFVVKSIVAAHGGSVSVSSKVGEGTRFDVTFPRRPPVNERGELISLDFA
ncbi:MAG: hybrid sensor histidine kinase/response regulator [Oligoflexia bacterium]|nr:hybrid sensor histidine kinase/response regulator [Oligoflexia bacterium]